MNASSICNLRFDPGAEVRAAVHQAILIFTSSEGALLQTVFVTLAGIVVDVLKTRCPATLAQMEDIYSAALRKIGGVVSGIIKGLNLPTGRTRRPSAAMTMHEQNEDSLLARSAIPVLKPVMPNRSE